MPVQGLQLQPPPGHGGSGVGQGVDEAGEHEAAREAGQGNTSDRSEYFVEIGKICGNQTEKGGI